MTKFQYYTCKFDGSVKVKILQIVTVTNALRGMMVKYTKEYEETQSMTVHIYLTSSLQQYLTMQSGRR